jgi:phosphoglycolate phosphatase
MLFQALEATGANPDDAVFIGDTTFDMEMAGAAKLQAIGVDWGYHRAERLLAAGASRVAHDIGELRTHIRELLENR